MRPKLTKRSIFGQTLQKLRKARGMTQEQLAEKIGCKKRLIVYYETEIENPPSSKNLIILAKALGTTPEALLFLENKKKAAAALAGDTEGEMFKAFKKYRQLPPEDQTTVIDLINSLLKKKSKKGGTHA